MNNPGIERLPVLTDVLEERIPVPEEGAPGKALLPEEAVDQLRAQARAAVRRLQEQLRMEIGHAVDADLEARIAALLRARVDALAEELAAELRPALLDLVHEAVTRVMAPGAGHRDPG